jgi:hypothetical protein
MQAWAESTFDTELAGISRDVHPRVAAKPNVESDDGPDSCELIEGCRPKDAALDPPDLGRRHPC